MTAMGFFSSVLFWEEMSSSCSRLKVDGEVPVWFDWFWDSNDKEGWKSHGLAYRFRDVNAIYVRN